MYYVQVPKLIHNNQMCYSEQTEKDICLQRNFTEHKTDNIYPYSSLTQWNQHPATCHLDIFPIQAMLCTVLAIFFTTVSYGLRA